ncbi:MAG: sucrase ferredoxin [Leptolyngbyaceae cyanobacterium RM2_2_4]|nr:sucrase ferredoxin [Leptolyngbyaceae cyanobacterium RM2_2_4]
MLGKQALPSLKDCRFCSQISKANGEDPIGTAMTCDHWLVMEIAPPWSHNLFKADPRIKPLVTLLKTLVIQKGVKLMIMLIAPDAEYSRPGLSRVMYYYRPAQLFSQFEKQEFVVPETEVTALATALLKQLLQQPSDLSRFQPYQQQTDTRDLMVCTHAQVDLACGRFGTPLYRRLRKEYAPASNGQLRVWQTSHIDGHQFAPTLVDLPEGRFWGHLEPEALKSLVWRTGTVSNLRQFYRGWAGLGKFEQMVEREIWMQEGWNWLSYAKSGQILAKDQKGIKLFLYRLLLRIPSKLVQFVVKELYQKEIKWAKVQIDFMSGDRHIVGTYEARVEAYKQITTAWDSSQPMKLKSVKQYQVNCITKVV